MQYIGKKKVKNVLGEDDTYIVTFDDKSVGRFKKALFDMIARDKEGEGEVYDVIRAIFAKKYVLDMADYGIDYLTCRHISMGIENLCHNMRETAIAKKFGVNTTDNMTISQVLEAYEE